MSGTPECRMEAPVRALVATLILTGVLGLSLHERAMILRNAFDIRGLVDARARAFNELSYAEAVGAGLSRPADLLEMAQARGIKVVRVDPSMVFEAGPAPVHRRTQ